MRAMRPTTGSGPLCAPKRRLTTPPRREQPRGRSQHALLHLRTYRIRGRSPTPGMDWRRDARAVASRPARSAIVPGSTSRGARSHRVMLTRCYRPSSDGTTPGFNAARSCAAVETPAKPHACRVVAGNQSVWRTRWYAPIEARELDDAPAAEAPRVKARRYGTTDFTDDTDDGSSRP